MNLKGIVKRFINLNCGMRSLKFTRLRNFNGENPDLWWSRVRLKLANVGVADEKAKFNLVAGSVPPIVAKLCNYASLARFVS